jgi:hypothetical protein
MIGSQFFHSLTIPAPKMWSAHKFSIPWRSPLPKCDRIQTFLSLNGRIPKNVIGSWLFHSLQLVFRSEDGLTECMSWEECRNEPNRKTRQKANLTS